jgi:hypothetical protein
MAKGKPSGQWIEKYWQWIYSLPKGKNPLETGSVSLQYNEGESIICLPCTGGGEACSRTLIIPKENAGKNILIPIFAAACSTAEVGEGYTDKTLLETARNDVLNPIHLEANVDGRPMQPHYVESAFFEVDIPQHPIFEVLVNRGRHSAASAGFWHKLDSLPPGLHKVQFGGTGRNGFHTAVEYAVKILT